MPVDVGNQLRNEVEVVLLEKEDLLDHLRVDIFGQLEGQVQREVLHEAGRVLVVHQQVRPLQQFQVVRDLLEQLLAQVLLLGVFMQKRKARGDDGLSALESLLGLLVVHERRQGAHHVRVEGHSDDDPHDVEPLFGNGDRVDVAEADRADGRNGPVERHCRLRLPR